MDRGVSLKTENLRRWVKKYPVGACLFTEEDASTMVYLIKCGRVQLIRRSQNYVLATVGPGSVLGEKALFSPQAYQHTITARVVEPTETIQFEASELSTIESKIPDFMIKLLETVTRRLEKTNEFVCVLQTRDLFERIALYLRYHVTHHRPGNGTHPSVSAAEIDQILQLEEGTSEPHLQNLVNQKSISFADGQYSVPALERLEHQIAKFGSRGNAAS